MIINRIPTRWPCKKKEKKKDSSKVSFNVPVYPATNETFLFDCVRDEIKSSGKVSILSQFKIARTPSPSYLKPEFPHPNLMNKTVFTDELLS